MSSQGGNTSQRLRTHCEKGTLYIDYNYNYDIILCDLISPAILILLRNWHGSRVHSRFQ